MDYNLFSNLTYCKEIVDGFRNLLLYSHIPSALIALTIGIFVYFKSKKSLLSKLLLFISIAFSFWAFLDLAIWLGYDRASLTMFAWAPIEIFSVLLFILSLYFAFVFTHQKDLSNIGKILIFSPLIPLIISAPTKFNLTYFDIQECIALENNLYSNYVLAVKLLFSLAIVTVLITGFKKINASIGRKRILILTSGLLIFIYSFLISGYISEITVNYTYEMYGLFGMIAFIGALSYLIVKFKEFNVKVLATNALIWALWVLIGSIFFVAQSTTTKTIVVITELIAVFFGIQLIKSVKREVEQRERLEVLSKELAAANDKLKELDKLKDEFLSFASHDLKSPVAKMKQWASLIYDKTYSTPQQIEETAFKIQTTGDRAIRLVDEFLNIRKIEEGRMEYNFEQKDIIGFVSGITNDFMPIAKQKGLELTFNSANHAINTNIDTIKMRQVIENLIDNSIKYTDPSTQLGASKGFIKVGVVEEQKSVLISVSDSGAGMEASVIPTLFGQFRRDPKVVKTIKGTGLGLYIAKQIVLAHKGEIWAQSPGANKGSTFLVRLPKA